jgi:phosphoserine phosphatase RsbU/P
MPITNQHNSRIPSTTVMRPERLTILLSLVFGGQLPPLRVCIAAKRAIVGFFHCRSWGRYFQLHKGTRAVQEMKVSTLFALSLLLVATNLLSAQTFDLVKDHEPVASLDGLWRFHTGDDLRWADPSFQDESWPLLRSDTSWTLQGYRGYGGFAWYRFMLRVPDGSRATALLLPPIYTGYQLYENGSLIGAAGSNVPSADPVLSDWHVFQLPAGRAGPQTIHIALRVWTYQPLANWLGGGPVRAGSLAGDSGMLQPRLHWFRSTRALSFVSTYAYCLVSALVGLTVLALFLFRREDREYLWFSVLLLAGAADAALNIALNFNLLPFTLCRFLGEVASGLSDIAALAFFSIVLRVPRSFSWWTACIAAMASPLTLLLFYLQWTGVVASYAALLCCHLPAYIWIIVTLAVCAIKKDTSASLLFAPVTLLYGFGTISLLWRISWQFGWKKNMGPFRSVFFDQSFPLYPENLVGCIFILALLIFLVRRFSLARQEETRLTIEMDAARSMQSLLVPAIAPATPGFTVECIYLPASEVGGDFFKVSPGPDGSLLVVVGDVSGKGLRAAMTVSTIVGALRSESSRQPTHILANLNRVLVGHIDGFVTCAVALISADGTMSVANAGNPAPYLNGTEMVVESGLPLGILLEMEYVQSCYQLVPGGRITFLSDGVVEATNQKRELFGFERTEAISHLAAQAIAETAQKFGQSDDISVLCVERTRN